MMGLDALILSFLKVSFKPTFSLSSFTFIKRLFSSSLSAIRVVSSAYLRLMFLLAVLILACASSSTAFCLITLSWEPHYGPPCTPKVPICKAPRRSWAGSHVAELAERRYTPGEQFLTRRTSSCTRVSSKVQHEAGMEVERKTLGL